MTIQQLHVDQIRCGPRQRQVDASKVADIAKSIEQHGILQAIGVRPLPDEHELFALVYGAHRLAAMVLLEHDTIAAYVLPPDLMDEEYLLMELQENCARNDLTGSQRKAFAAEIGRLSAKLAEEFISAIGTDDWLSRMAQTCHVPRRTMYNWWNAFRHEAGLTLTPSQALYVHQEHFFAWLEAQQRQEEEAKQHQADERKRQLQQEDCDSAVDHLVHLAQKYGVAVVDTQVIGVFTERFVRTSHA